MVDHAPVINSFGVPVPSAGTAHVFVWIEAWPPRMGVPGVAWAGGVHVAGVLRKAVHDRLIVEPLDLVIDVPGLGEPMIRQGREIEHRDAPRDDRAGIPLLERDACSVRRERRAFDT